MSVQVETIEAGKANAANEHEVKSLGGPGAAPNASHNLRHDLESLGKSRLNSEQAIRDAAALFYRELNEQGTRSAAEIVTLIGPYIRAFRPSDKDLGELLKDTNPMHLVMPKPTLWVEAGQEPMEKPTKAKPTSAYKQYAAIWRDLSDIEHGMWDRKKWENTTAEAKQQIAVGVSINGKSYSSPVTALEALCPVVKTHRAFMDVLKPRVINLDTDVSGDQEQAARDKAASIKVVVKVFNEEMSRHQPTAVNVSEHNATLAGVILGLLDQAVLNKVSITGDQQDAIIAALEKVC